MVLLTKILTLTQVTQGLEIEKFLSLNVEKLWDKYKTKK